MQKNEKATKTAIRSLLLHSYIEKYHWRFMSSFAVRSQVHFQRQLDKCGLSFIKESFLRVSSNPVCFLCEDHMRERHDRDNFGIMSRLYVSMTGITVPNRLHSAEIMKSDAFCSQPCTGPGNCGKSFFLSRFLCKNYDNDAYYFVFHFDI